MTLDVDQARQAVGRIRDSVKVRNDYAARHSEYTLWSQVLKEIALRKFETYAEASAVAEEALRSMDISFLR